ncbi:MAG: hypothetical protein ABSE95_14425 [Thermodesulfobacteriota bacterium]
MLKYKGSLVDREQVESGSYWYDFLNFFIDFHKFYPLLSDGPNVFRLLTPRGERALPA